MGCALKMVDWYDSFAPTFLASMTTLHLAGLIYPEELCILASLSPFGPLHCVSFFTWGHLGALPPNFHILLAKLYL